MRNKLLTVNLVGITILLSLIGCSRNNEVISKESIEKTSAVEIISEVELNSETESAYEMSEDNISEIESVVQTEIEYESSTEIEDVSEEIDEIIVESETFSEEPTLSISKTNSKLDNGQYYFAFWDDINTIDSSWWNEEGIFLRYFSYAHIADNQLVINGSIDNQSLQSIKDTYGEYVFTIDAEKFVLAYADPDTEDYYPIAYGQDGMNEYNEDMNSLGGMGK